MKKISTDEFDRRFDEGEDVTPYLDLSESWRPGIAELAKKARKATGLTQQAFAERYGFPLATFQDWEQGRRVPDAGSRAYLRVIAQIPDAVAKALDDAA